MKELAVGGAERLLLEIAPELRSEVEFLPVVVMSEPRTYGTAYSEAGHSVIDLGATHPYSGRWVFRLREIIQQRSPDVVHLHLPYVGALGRLGALGTGRPIVYTEHSLWSRYHPLSRIANALTFRVNDGVIWVSDAVRRSAWQSSLIGSQRQIRRVIHNGVAADRVVADAVSADSPGTGGFAYGTVGHLRHEKGIDVLLHASVLIDEQLPGSKGFVAGGGEDAEAISDIRRRLRAPIELLGVRNDARRLIGGVRVFVLPSRVEGLPVSLLEAMALGKPIVATRAGGVPEAIVDGESGLLVDGEDPEALAGAIVRLLENPALAERLGRRAQEVARERFTSQAMANGYLEMYRAVLQRGVPA